MPRSGVAALIATAVILVVLLYGLGAFDSAERASRLVVGGCDIPGQDVGTIVSLTTSFEIASGRYESFDSPDGTDYVVPARRELWICQLNTVGMNTGTATGFTVGYADGHVESATSTPAGATGILHAVIPDANAQVVFDALAGPIPEGKYPYAYQAPGAAWAATAVGFEIETE